LSSLIVLRYVCKRLLAVAETLLGELPTVYLVNALTKGLIPDSCVAAIERRAASAALTNSLPEDALLRLTKYANLFINGCLYPAQPWELECHMDGGSMLLRPVGFDCVPLHQAACPTLASGTASGTGSVTEWYATHEPSRPLGQPWMPCILVQPISTRPCTTRAQMTRLVPMQFVRAVKRPTPKDCPPEGTPRANLVDDGRSWDPFAPLEAGLQPRGMALIDALVNRDNGAGSWQGSH